MDGQLVLVLWRNEQDDALPCAAPLPEPQTSGGQDGGMGREEPGRRPGAVSQSQVGEAVRPFPRVGQIVADRTDEDDARAARMDEWLVWEAEERIAPRGEG